MENKKCKKCNIEKELHFFYNQLKMKDGKLNICIDCVKKRVSERENKLKKDPEWVEKEKIRGREKYHRLNKNWKKPNYKEKAISSKKHRERYPEKYKARNAAQRIKKTKGNALHHWSYNEKHWKDVIELCVSDHAILHRHIIYDQETKLYRNKSTNEILKTKESHIELLKIAQL